MRPGAIIARLRSAFLSPLDQQVSQLRQSVDAIHLVALAAAPRYADPRCLIRHGYRIFSQSDEDGLIDEVFRRIGMTNRFFVEFGVGEGFENNTLALLLSGWRGLWIEAEEAPLAAFRETFQPALEEDRLTITASVVTAENIENLLGQGGCPEEPDLLSIDIDGNDYWVWKAIHRFRPRLVVIEYNASLGRAARLTVPYDPAFRWDRTTRYGTSLAALESLGCAKGYALVGCSLAGVNAFFVRNDCLGDHFLPPYTSARHYEPPRFGPRGAGHPPGWGQLVTV